MLPLKISIILFSAVLFVTFLVIGFSGPDDAPVSSTNTSQWESAGMTLKYACSDNGKLVGDVYEDAGGWTAKVWPGDGGWGHLEQLYRNRNYAEKAAEKYIQEHKSCN